MKKLFFILLILSIGLTNVWGQKKNREEAMRKVEAYRIEFFTKNLDLTEKEAEKFWPIYSDYQAKQQALKDGGESMRKVALMSDAEVDGFLTEHLEKEQKMLDLKKDFFRKIKEVLPVRKVAMIPSVEQRFRKEIFSEMKKRREGMLRDSNHKN